MFLIFFIFLLLCLIIDISCVIISSRISKKENDENQLNFLSLEEHYKYYENQGLTKKEIIKKIAKDRNVNKNEIYMKFV